MTSNCIAPKFRLHALYAAFAEVQSQSLDPVLAQLLRSQVNSQNPIVCLSREIISRIFMFVQRDHDDPKCNNYYNRAWLVVCHICRSWRDIAIGTESLWTYMETAFHSSLEQTKTYLERSGTSQLVVQHYICNRTKATALDSLSMVLQDLHRIREFHIWHEDAFKNPKLEKQLKNPAPVLRKFCLALDLESDISSLFAGQAPKLEDVHLHVDQSSSPWSSIPILRNLKSMTLGSFSKPVSLQQVLSLSSANPDLEDLAVYNAPYGVLYDAKRYPSESCSVPSKLLYLIHFCVEHVNYEMFSQALKSMIIPNIASWQAICYFPIDNLSNRYISPCGSIYDKKCSKLALQIFPSVARFEADPIGPINHEAVDTMKHRYLECFWVNDGARELSLDALSASEIICSIIRDEFWCLATELRVFIDARMFSSLSQTSKALCWIQLLRSLPYLEKITVNSYGSHSSVGQAVMDPHLGLLEALTVTQLNKEVGAFQLICPGLLELELIYFDFGIGIQKLIQSLEFRIAHTRASRLRRLKVLGGFEGYRFPLDGLRNSKIADEVTVNIEA